MSNLRLFSSLSLVALLTISLAARCQVSTSVENTYIPSQKLHELLRRPDGLTQLSKEFGNVVIDSPIERWGQHDLKALVRNSDLVVLGTLASRDSHFSNDGDSISTTYHVSSAEILKGVPPENLKFDEVGGFIALPTGYTVTVTSPVWNSLVPSSKYILFLNKQGDRYKLVGSVQGALAITGEPSKVHLIDQDPSQSTSLRTEVEALDPETVIALIKSTQ